MSMRQRKLRNLIITPKFQLRFIFYCLGFTTLTWGGLCWSMWSDIQQLHTSLFNGGPRAVDVQGAFTLIKSLQYSILAYFVAGTLGLIGFTLVISHRFAGAANVILSNLQSLKQGRFEALRALRRHDELEDINQAICDLAKHLAKLPTSEGRND